MRRWVKHHSAASCQPSVVSKNRVLDFDSAAATEATSLAAERQKAGRPVDMRDTQIAGISLAWRATLAARNVRHFADLKVPVVDPWETG